jgi:hypothetical protein
MKGEARNGREALGYARNVLKVDVILAGFGYALDGRCRLYERACKNQTQCQGHRFDYARRESR